MSNIGYLFGNRYFKEENSVKPDVELLKMVLKKKGEYNEEKVEKIINEKNTEIMKSSINMIKNPQELGDQFLNLRIQYPGLIVGTGNGFGIGLKQEFKTGLTFDWTTGLPLISGSAIKGIVKSAFPIDLENRTFQSEDDEKNYKEYNQNRVNYISSILESMGKSASESMVNEIKYEIFEGVDFGCVNQEGTDKVKVIPMYRRDKFFDAQICLKESKVGEILEEDFITPHKEELKNPVPLKILKIKHGVCFRANFDLKDGVHINADEKLTLIKLVLGDLGLGAKTNLGYGYFDVENADKEYKESKEKEKKEESDKMLKDVKQKRAEMSEVDRYIDEYNDILNEFNQNEKNAILNDLLVLLETKEYDEETVKGVDFLLKVYSENGKPSKKVKMKIERLNKIKKEI